MKLVLASIAVAFVASTASAQQYPTNPYHVTAGSLLGRSTSSLGAAATSTPRPLSPLTVDLVKDFEGWSPTAYDDAVGYCTIGYGHLIAEASCGRIELGVFATALTEPQGLVLLEEDSRIARRIVQRLVTVELNEHQYGALSAFVFNIGGPQFADSTLLRLLNAGQYDLAADQFARWVRGGPDGRVIPGLVTRRACEEALFRGQLTYDVDGRFTRSACVSLGAAAEAGPLIDIRVGETN